MKENEGKRIRCVGVWIEISSCVTIDYDFVCWLVNTWDVVFYLDIGREYVLLLND